MAIPQKTATIIFEMPDGSNFVLKFSELVIEHEPEIAEKPAAPHYLFREFQRTGIINLKIKGRLASETEAKQ